MPIKIKAAQSFTDRRSIVHTAAHGAVKHMIIDLQGTKSLSIRLEVYIDQTRADAGDSSANIKVFQTTISGADFDTFFAEATLLLVDKSVLVQAELAIMAADNVIDSAIWEII